MIQLSDGITSLMLHDDLLWVDEHNWHPVEQSINRTITGSLIVSTAQRIAGRPITLQSIDDSNAWHTLAQVNQLRNWAAVAGLALTLTLRATVRRVLFAHHEGAAIEATPVVHYSDVSNADFYRITLRLIEM
ncbi:hypothetical protein [Glaciimonas soli]|uniref:Uncharacterized protein n=1 Tax=Glaciimonas soli TaxID=2590999 RepID=A0A843YYQ4_9BURK|nr:hypothetical protein [Glaciimonas soli]MQR02322.1 hypothetical protein [Glaciimonas soli]